MSGNRPSSRELWTLLEPVHAIAYFAPEPVAALKAAGYRGYWMGYFAGRAAPLGAVPAPVVHALFYNFRYDRVRRALPDAWSYAPPDVALRARETGSVAALRRLLTTVDADAIEVAADLATTAAASAPAEGRALFAAYQALPVPDEPLARLWHAATLLREHRGDGHVAALLVADVPGRASHVLHAGATGAPRTVYDTARDFDDDEWNAELSALQTRGLLDPDGTLSEQGAATKTWVEDRTDALADTAFDILSDHQLHELRQALRPITRAVIAGGDIPATSPMGLKLGDAVD